MRRFASCVRSNDTLARTGGDEFCVVVERPVIHDAAASVAKRLKESLLAPANVSGEKYNWVRASASQFFQTMPKP